MLHSRRVRCATTSISPLNQIYSNWISYHSLLIPSFSRYMNTKNTGQIEVANSQDIYGAVSPVLAEPSRLQMTAMERLLISQSVSQAPRVLRWTVNRRKTRLSITIVVKINYLIQFPPLWYLMKINEANKIPDICDIFIRFSH